MVLDEAICHLGPVAEQRAFAARLSMSASLAADQTLPAPVYGRCTAIAPSGFSLAVHCVGVGCLGRVP
jgi:hypothetical protein